MLDWVATFCLGGLATLVVHALWLRRRQRQARPSPQPQMEAPSHPQLSAILEEIRSLNQRIEIGTANGTSSPGTENSGLNETRPAGATERLVIEVNRIPANITRMSVPHSAESLSTIRALIEKYAKPFSFAVVETELTEGNTAQRRTSQLEEYERLRESGVRISMPKTWTLSQYQLAPVLPVVAKLQHTSKGRNKYLIENGDQFDCLRRWIETCGRPDDWLFQEFIHCPSGSYSTFRVIVDCVGELHTSQIIYGAPKDMPVFLDRGADSHECRGALHSLEEPRSEFYLRSRDISSNRLFVSRRIAAEESTYVYDAAGSGMYISIARHPEEHDPWQEYYNEDGMIGGRLTLDPTPASHPYSDRERQILRDYGLADGLRNTPSLPMELREAANRIGRTLGIEGRRVKDLFFGVDFVQDASSRTMYLLEWNRRPSVASIRDYFGGVPLVPEHQAYEWLIQRTIAGIARQYSERQALDE